MVKDAIYFTIWRMALTLLRQFSWYLFSSCPRALVSKKIVLSGSGEVRNGIKRVFGVPTMSFYILSLLFRLHDRVDTTYVMQTCTIMHNRIVKARRAAHESELGRLQQFENNERMFRRGPELNWKSREATNDFMSSTLNVSVRASMVSSRVERIRSAVEHFSLKLDLIERVWRRQLFYPFS